MFFGDLNTILVTVAWALFAIDVTLYKIIIDKIRFGSALEWFLQGYYGRVSFIIACIILGLYEFLLEIPNIGFGVLGASIGAIFGYFVYGYMCKIFKPKIERKTDV